MTTPGVIQEGGLGGHIDHLYENPSLSFGEMKEIFQIAASGELEGSEKTDGQNIYLSYSLKRGIPLAARNKTQVKAGGLDASGLAKFFEGRGALQKAFVDGFESYGQAVAQFSPEEIEGAFGQDGDIYYSAEVMDPESANVIDYDEKILNLHQTGHGRVNKETGGIEADHRDPDVQKASVILDKAIESFQSRKQASKFKVQRSEILKLQSVTEGKHSERAISQLDAITGGDAETIGEFIVKKIKPIIKEKLSLPKDKMSQMLQKMLGSKGYNIAAIKKGLSPEEQKIIDEFMVQRKIILKQVVHPIEMIVHEFAVAALEGLQSIYMLGAQDKKIQTIRDKVATEIDAIEAGTDKADMALLATQLNKMKYAETGLEGITTTAEGFVFDFNGHTYKFTGNYAPVNQILGILRYKRSGDKEVNEILKEQKIKGIALFPGAFKPPHAGHYQAAVEASKERGVDKLIVLVSSKEREGVSAEQSLQIWQIYKKALGGNFDVQVSTVASPIGATFKFIDDYAKPGQTIYVVKGKKDAGDKRFQAMAGRKEGVEIEEIISTVPSGISGTDMRKYITVGDICSFQDGLPKSLDFTIKNKIWDIASTGKTGLNEYLARVINEVLDQNLLFEVESEKQRKWACAQLGDNYRGERKLTNKQAKEMCSSKIEESATKAFGQVAIAALDKENLKNIVTKIQAGGGALEEQIEEIVEQAFASSIPNFKEPTDLKDELTEVSAMGSGAIEGAGSGWTNFDEEENEEEKPGGKLMEYKTFSRKQLLEEELLRENIRKVIVEVKTTRKQTQFETQKRESVLRELIQELILEADETAPHESTGINVLEDLLKKIVPQIEGDFKTLTTDAEQRNSFRAHILNATENTIAPKSAVQDDSPEESGMLGSPEEAEGVDELEEIEVKVGNAEETEEEVAAGDLTGLDDDEKLIDIDPMGGGPADDGSFEGLEGEDDTGRNMANMSFQKIEKSIQDSFDLLGNEEDQKLFRDYLLTNLKLYFDKFEDELGAGGEEEPTTPEYEEEKEEEADTEEAGGEEEPGGGEEEEIDFEL